MGVDPLLEFILVAHLFPFPQEQVLFIIENIVKVNGDYRQPPLIFFGGQMQQLQVVQLLLHHFLGRIHPHTGNSLIPQGLTDMLHAGHAHADPPLPVIVPVELQKLALKIVLLFPKRRPEDPRLSQPRQTQYLPQQLLFIAVYTDGPCHLLRPGRLLHPCQCL